MARDIDILFRGFLDRDRKAFLDLGEEVAFEADEVVLPAGRSEWDLYLVREGQVSVWVGQVRLSDLGPGQVIGSSAMLFPQIQWSAVRANEKSVLLQVPRESAMGFFENRHRRLFQQFCVNLFRTWVEVLRQRNERITEIQSQILGLSPVRGDRRFRLLVVDDEIEILKTMEEFFGLRYDVAVVQDSREALAQTLAQKPDLVLLDLRMPGMDGYEVCKQLKTHPEIGAIPIVVITAMNSTPDRVKGLMYGADEYFNKPVDLEVLDETVARILAKVYG